MMAEKIHGRTWEEWQRIREIHALRTDKITPPNGAYQEVSGEKIHKTIVAIHNKLCDGTPPVITIDGEEQSGKSNVAMIIAETLHDKLNSCKGTWTSDNLLYYPAGFANAVDTAECQVLVIDEAGRSINARDHNSKENEAVKGLIETQGFKKNIVILINPDISEIDKTIRGKPYIHIDVREPGKAKPKYRIRVRSEPEDGPVYSTRPLPVWWFGIAPERIQNEYRPKELRYKTSLPEKFSDEIKQKKAEESHSSLSDL